jgi:hypothetical protein
MPIRTRTYTRSLRCMTHNNNNMKKLLLIIALFPLLALGQQTAQLNFTRKNNTQLGKWQVVDLPTSLFIYSVPQGQVLTYIPPAYYRGKKCAVGIWQGGKGELTSLDVSEVYKNSLPFMIQNGLTPYSILPNKDTLWHILVCIHSNIQGAYRDPLRQIVPWILDSLKDVTTGKRLTYDSAYTWASGLSEGGSGTWALFMVDSLLSKRVHFNVAMANGGYDDNLVKLMSNLQAAIRHGVIFLPYIGTQDPGFNPGGFLAYKSFLETNAPGQFFPRIITNGTHGPNVWDVPWKSRGFWDTIGLFGYKAAPVNPLKGKAKLWVDSLTKHYPNTFFHFADSSTAKHNFTSWGVTVYTSDDPGQWTSGGPYSPDMFLFNLKDGLYKVQLIIGDDAGNTDTATITLKAYGPPACPAPRKVKTLQVQAFGLWIIVPLEAAKIGYDDGNP